MPKNVAGLALALLIVTPLFGWTARARQVAPAAPSVTRTVMNQQDLAVPGYAVALIRVELPVGGREGRHSHPGTLVAYVQEGTMTLEFEGKPTLTFKAGETFYVEPGQVHEGMNKGTVPVRVVASFVFPKDKPMTVPVK